MAFLLQDAPIVAVLEVPGLEILGEQAGTNA
jgi:hypothetical protein